MQLGEATLVDWTEPVCQMLQRSWSSCQHLRCFMGALGLSHCDIPPLKGREHTRFINARGQK